MTLNSLVAILASIALQANPSPQSIPLHINPLPMAGVAVARPMKPEKKHFESLGVETTASSAIVVDVGSGSVLYAKSAEVPHPVASLTKLMTAMVILDQGLHGEESLTIAQSDFDPLGRRYVEAAESMKRIDAFRAMLVGSVNELANAFARTSPGGGESFIDAMNAKAKSLGMKGSKFVDSSGIEPKNVASATDIARMLRSAVAYPEIREMTGSVAFDLRTSGGRLVNIKPTNNLLTSYLNKDPYKIMVGKTGSLPEAGYCLGTVTRHPDGQEVIAVVLGSNNHFSRFQEVKSLTSWAFETYAWHKNE